MKVSLDWLKEYIDIDLEPNVLAEKIARTSVEIEDVYQPVADMSGVVIGRVLSVEPHPDSDHMVVTKIDAGEAEPIQIVTGAPNIAPNQLVILAKHNAKIGDGKKIKKGKLRGVVSNGMLAALQEIGFDDKIAPKDLEAGIWVFNENDDVKPGDDAFEVLGMRDWILEPGITPNRADMLSMNGTAYEVGAMLNQKPRLPKVEIKETSKLKTSELLKITADKVLAPKYMVRIIDNLEVKDSPLWLQKRLWNAGMRPINNIVDATNYAMLTFGQPLHAFDYNKLPSNNLTVRLAKSDETLATLDDVKRELRPNQDIVISAETTPLMLAGVMGGASTEVTKTTTRIVLESAIFNPHNIRATARRHDLHSEASQRFERGVNWDDTQTALDYAAQLIAEMANGAITEGILVANDETKAPVTVTVSLARINKVLGLALTKDNVLGIFNQLGFATQFENNDFIVSIPSRRWDISIPADLLEEVARIYGYDNIPATLPSGRATIGQLTYKQQMIRTSRHLLEALGLSQAISYGLTTDEKAAMFTFDKTAEITSLDYPMTQERTATRMSLITGLLDDIAYNNARKQFNVALYEQGRVFYRAPEEIRPTEIEHIAGAISGKLAIDNWHSKERDVDFYAIKGIVENYLKHFEFKAQITFQPTHNFEDMHPGRTASIFIGEHFVGFVGQVHPSVVKKYKLKETYVFELDLQQLIDLKKRDRQYRAISKFPSITRDIAILVDENIEHAVIEQLIAKNGGKHLIDITLFDVYSGKNLVSGKKSMAYTLTYQDAGKTLVDEEVTSAFAKVVASLTNELGAEIR